MIVLVKGEKIELEKGSTLKTLSEKLKLTMPHQGVAATINGDQKDFSVGLNDGDNVEFFDFESDLGKEVFWHTSAHVLAQAILRLYPKAQPTIGPPIEKGFYYDFANLEISEDDFKKIEKEIKKIISENHKTERSVFASKKEALEAFKDSPYKCELINGFDENGEFSAYKQGEFFDLCRGPHLFNIGKIKAFKLMKTSGAYWRGDSDREMLTRIYGISFPDKEDLKKYLHQLEEAKKRDHRLLGNKLDLFSFHEEAPGMPFIHPKGSILWNQLVSFWRKLHRDCNYEEILTPQLVSKSLWETSGHWDHYKENMYLSSIEEKEFALKPMNCPGCMLYFKSKSHSYRQFPLRIAEFGHVHRHELSGSLNGLFRVRSFHQDDAHIFMTPSQIKEEILGVLELADRCYSLFGLKYVLELSTRPEKSKTIGSDEEWEVATAGLKDALDEWGAPYTINEGDGAFYGPKIDIHILDSLERSWQCGTIQLDMSLPQKFDLHFTDHDGEMKRPVMIHRAIFGSIERFLGIIIEHFAGKFPLWINPRPVRILNVADRHLSYAKEVQRSIEKAGIICEIDSSNESVSKKVRTAQLLQINYMLTIGDKEMENKSINVRTRNNIVHGELTLEKFLATIETEYNTQSLHSMMEDTKEQ